VLNVVFNNISVYHSSQFQYNHIDSVMLSVLVSCAVNHGFKPRSGKTKD